LLQNDRVVIPTKDFGIVSVLDTWCGTECLIDLLEQGAFAFAWEELLQGYRPNGEGVSNYAVDQPKGGWENSAQAAMWGELEESAEAQIYQAIKGVDGQKITDLVLKNSFESASIGLNAAKEQTFADLMSLRDRGLLPKQHSILVETDLDNLPGISSKMPNAFCYGDEVVMISNGRDFSRNSFDYFLELVQANNELLKSEVLEIDSVITESTFDILNHRADRHNVEKAFATILKVEDTLDPKSALLSGDLTFKEIERLRKKVSSRNFRKVLHEISQTADGDPDAIRSEYHKIFRGLNTSSWRKELLIFGISQVLEPFGLMTDVSSLPPIKRYKKNYAAIYFFEDLGRLPFNKVDD
jgi:hypothetical protein